MENSVTISLDRYTELLNKEFVYNSEKRKLERHLKMGLYVTPDDCELYGLPVTLPSAEEMKELSKKLYGKSEVK